MNKPTIAHLSDLHINHRYYPERSALLHNTLSECERRKVGHLVVTGDLSHLGEAEELEQCAAIFREHGYWDSNTLTVTIGNHDIFGGPYFAEDVLTFPGKCKETDYPAKVKLFNAVFAPSFDSTIHGEGDEFYPFVKLLGDIALIGINTVATWSGLKNPLGSNGTVDAGQFDRLTRILNDSRLQGRRLFALTHHHVHAPKYIASCSVLGTVWQRIVMQTEKMRGRKRLLGVLTEHGVEKILHGHIHEHAEYRERGMTCLNAGASMLPPANEERNYHIIPAGCAVSDRHSADRPQQQSFRPSGTRARFPRYQFST